jgi:BASS family bile acid:Na+ symporter
LPARITLDIAIVAAVNVSLAMSVLGVGLRATAPDSAYLRQHRGLLARSVLAMDVLLPLFAVWLALMFELSAPVAVALVAVAISPLPTFLPIRIARVNGESPFAVCLSLVAALLAIAIVPLSVWLVSRMLGMPLHQDLRVVAGLLTTSVVLPLALGVWGRRAAPRAAARAVTPVSIAATATLALAIIAMLVQARSAMPQLLEQGTLGAIVVMTIAALAIGHACGGPEGDERPVLATATATRHPAIAIAIGTTAFPNEPIVGAVIALALLLGGLATAPYSQLSRFTLPRL